MEEVFLLSDAERLAIFRVLSENKRLSFNRLKDAVGLRSNKLSYQLKLMVERGFLVHEGDEYGISLSAERLVPYFSQIFKKEVGVLPVLLGIVRHGSKILLIKRKKLPYKGWWSLIGGKQVSGESIPETIVREVMEEANVPAMFDRVNGVLYERLREDGKFKHSFLFVVVTVNAQSESIASQNEGEVSWFDFDDVLKGKVERIIPSDLHIIKEYHSKSSSVEHVILEERGEELVMVER